MKRSSNQKETGERSNRKMTMKTSNTLALFASICIASTFSTVAHAGSTSNNKYGPHMTDPATTAPRVHYVPDMGTFLWLDENARVNHIVVSLADQTLNAFDGSTLVGYSNISSGKPGHETPSG